MLVNYDKVLVESFNDILYEIRVLAQENKLYLEVEQQDNGFQWKNQFTDKYIEEMTTRTGNYKSFETFSKMIYTALDTNSTKSSHTSPNISHTSDDKSSVFIDLLTYQDLEILKERKRKMSTNNTESPNDPNSGNGSNTTNHSSLNVTQRTKNKRYLILTYIVEFDRVHYPLALKFDFDSVNSKQINNNNSKQTTQQKEILSKNKINKLLLNQNNSSRDINNDEYKSQSPAIMPPQTQLQMEIESGQNRNRINTKSPIAKISNFSNINNINKKNNIDNNKKIENDNIRNQREFSHSLHSSQRSSIRASPVSDNNDNNNVGNVGNKRKNQRKSYSNSDLLDSGNNVDKQRLLEENAKLKELLSLQQAQIRLQAKEMVDINIEQNGSRSPELIGSNENGSKRKRNKDQNERLSRQSVIESDNDEIDRVNNNKRKVIDNRNKVNQVGIDDYNKLFELIDVLEDENRLLKTELQKKNLEIKKMKKSSHQIHKKQVSKKLEELEDEIDRLSTELLDEKTKVRRVTKDFRIEKLDLEKQIEQLENSLNHYKIKCKKITKDLQNTQESLDGIRTKASKQRLYSASSTSLTRTKSSKGKNNNKNKNRFQSNSLNNSNRYKKYDYKQKAKNHQLSNVYDYRRSRSRTNKPLFNSKSPRFRNNNNNNSGPNTSRTSFGSTSSQSTARTYQPRSMSASRLGNTSRSPSIGRFDPTAWAQKRKEKILAAKKKSTFGGINSRSPSPCHSRTSRSASPASIKRFQVSKSRSNSRKKRIGTNINNLSFNSNISNTNRSQSRKKKKLRGNSKKSNRFNNNGSQSNRSNIDNKLKRNSFGRTISRSRSPRIGGVNNIGNNSAGGNGGTRGRNIDKPPLGIDGDGTIEKLNELSEKLKKHREYSNKNRIGKRRSKDVKVTFDSDDTDDSDLNTSYQSNKENSDGSVFKRNGSALLSNAKNHVDSKNRFEKNMNSIKNDSDTDESQFNASKEIESIDARLNALQSFLRAAKSQS